jgi:hypothetical protein
MMKLSKTCRAPRPKSTITFDFHRSLAVRRTTPKATADSLRELTTLCLVLQSTQP